MTPAHLARRLSACVLAVAILCLFIVGGAARAETCVASFYGSESGSRTANGERFNPGGMTAASRHYPFGTRLRVTYRGRSVVVRVNDRGPFVKGRCLDLAHGAAKAIRLPGVGLVTIQVIH